jgi:hypothetical protein
MTIHYESEFSGDRRDAALPAPHLEAIATASIAYSRSRMEPDCRPEMQLQFNSGFVALCAGFFAAQPSFERIVVDFADQEVAGSRKRNSSL